MNGSHNVDDNMDSSHTNNQSHEKSLTPFPAANDDYRYLRKRATILCTAFNAQPVDIPDKERARAWNEYVFMRNPNNQYHMLRHR